MLRLAFDFIIAWREIRARPNAYKMLIGLDCPIYCGKVFPTSREKILLFCGNKFS